LVGWSQHSNVIGWKKVQFQHESHCWECDSCWNRTPVNQSDCRKHLNNILILARNRPSSGVLENINQSEVKRVKRGWDCVWELVVMLHATVQSMLFYLIKLTNVVGALIKHLYLISLFQFWNNKCCETPNTPFSQHSV
jgi:hypothetical protein